MVYLAVQRAQEFKKFITKPQLVTDITWISSHQFNKLTSVFHASVLLVIMNFVITLTKYVADTNENVDRF